MIISTISMISTVGMTSIRSRLIGSSMASASCMILVMTSIIISSCIISASCMPIGMSAISVVISSMSGISMVRKTCRE